MRKCDIETESLTRTQRRMVATARRWFAQEIALYTRTMLVTADDMTMLLTKVYGDGFEAGLLYANDQIRGPRKAA